MKKIIITVLAAFIAISASAGDFGVTAGFTSSKASLKDLELSSVNLYHVGLTYRQSFLGVLALQPELLYNVKGTTLDHGLNGASVDVKMGYLEAGLQLQAGVDILFARLFALVEPYAGYCVNSQYSSAQRDPIKEDALNNIEYGMAFGGGIELLQKIQVSAKYFRNLGDLSGASASQIKDDVSGFVHNALDKSNYGGVQVSFTFLF